MFHHKLSHETGWRTLSSWFLLSFISGNVNAGGFLACNRFVTHVTGFATLAGVALANGKRRDAFVALTVPVFFLLGVIISGLWIERPLSRGLKPHYVRSMGAVTFGLLIVVFLGGFHSFGPFGTLEPVSRDFFLLAVLCLVSGLQNAAVTTSSGATVRTTHLTGVTTDLGLGLVRVFGLPGKSTRKSLEWKAIQFRLGTIVSFILGSAAGAALFYRFQYLGFILPCALAMVATVFAARHHDAVTDEAVTTDAPAPLTPR